MLASNFELLTFKWKAKLFISYIYFSSPRSVYLSFIYLFISGMPKASSFGWKSFSWFISNCLLFSITKLAWCRTNKLATTVYACSARFLSLSPITCGKLFLCSLHLISKSFVSFFQPLSFYGKQNLAMLPLYCHIIIQFQWKAIEMHLYKNHVMKHNVIEGRKFQNPLSSKSLAHLHIQ